MQIFQKLLKLYNQGELRLGFLIILNLLADVDGGIEALATCQQVRDTDEMEYIHGLEILSS